MKLSIEQLSKLTKLSIPTLRVYVSRQKLGTKVGNKRVFSQSDVQKLLKASKKSPAVKKQKAPAKKALPAKKRATSKPSVPPAAQPGGSAAKAKVKPASSSFWTRLFGGPKKKPKIRLLDAKTTR